VNVIPEKSTLIVDIGVSLFHCSQMMMPCDTHFISQIFYGSIGFSVGAALGAMIADPHRPVFLIVGDGAFQMTCQEISTMIRYNCRPTIFLINNRGYTIERVFHDGIYNDIQNWNYTSLPVVFGATNQGISCQNEFQISQLFPSQLQQHHIQFQQMQQQQQPITQALGQIPQPQQQITNQINPSINDQFPQQQQPITDPLIQQQTIVQAMNQFSQPQQQQIRNMPGDSFRFIEILVPKNDFPEVMKKYSQKGSDDKQQIQKDEGEENNVTKKRKKEYIHPAFSQVSFHPQVEIPRNR
jgi:TPP-dependent 2-oxoacid decarboxylase